MSENINQLSESLEDYLEKILALENINKVARVKEIAEAMGVLQGSVTSALKTLTAKGLINYEPYSFITLTPKGKKLAQEVTRRHAVIKDFLINVLQLEMENAEANACRIEHAIDRVAIDRLVQFIDYINNCPRTGPEWIASFTKSCAERTFDAETCKRCLKHCKDAFLATA